MDFSTDSDFSTISSPVIGASSFDDLCFVTDGSLIISSSALSAKNLLISVFSELCS